MAIQAGSKVSITGKGKDNALPQLNALFLPLVQTCRQVVAGYEPDWEHGETPEKFNGYVVNQHGELVELWLTQAPVIDWSMLSQCRSLETLVITSSALTEFPEALLSLVSLKTLDFSFNQLSQLPEHLGQLKSLNYLFLMNNQLTQLPDSLGQLSSLQALLLSSNQLTQLPDTLGQLSSLRHLFLRNNQLTALPETISQLDSLLGLKVQDNPMPIPDPSFHRLNPQEQIQTLLAIQSSDLQPLKQAKILVVGDERVGKTSVINRLLGHSHNDNQSSTQGIDISQHSFADFSANIWDFAGQELTHQTHQFFLTERSLYLYVLDAQKEDNQARDTHWLNTIKSYSENSPIIVVVNHSDQNLNYRFDRQRYQDDFQIVEVIYTSACNLNTLTEPVKIQLGDSIDKLDAAITRQLPKLPGIDRELPESWHQVKKAMEGFKQQQNVIAKDVYEAQCQKAGVLGKPLQTALLKILNSIGTVVAYPNDFRLRLTQILKPEWVTNAVYKIVRSPSDTPGFYSEQAIGIILDGDYTAIHQQWLIDLLIKFELGFRLPENNELLIPMRPPPVRPEFDKSRYQKGLNIRFNYHRRGLLKLNVLPQLIVRMHHYVDEQTFKYWRHGLFIRLNDCQGVIISDETNQSIEVYFTHHNEDARNLLQWIRTNLKKIEQSQIKANKDNALPYIEEIALFDEQCSNILGHENYQRIERAHAKGKETLNLEVKDPQTGEPDDQDFNVAKLLGLYQSKNSQDFEPRETTKFLINALLRLTELRAKIIHEQEDDINDRLRESLRSGGFSIRDQSRGGFSGSGNGVGERDLVILDQYGQQASLIEAMVLTSATKKTITSHYQKLVNQYNTQGNPVDFLLTYAKVKNFTGLWQKYQGHIQQITDVTDDFTDKSNLKVGSSKVPIEGSDQGREVIHLLVNFGVTP